MRNRFRVVAILLAGAVAACGTDGPHHAQPAGEIQQAASRTAAAKTGHFEMTIAANDPRRAVSLTATGSFDAERHLFSVVMDSSTLVPGLDGRLAIIATPDTLFVDCPYLAQLLGAATSWISVRGPAGELFRASVVDPLQLLDTIRSGEVVPDNGVEIEVGDDGLVRRIAMRFDAAGTAAGAEGAALISVEYSDFGAPVTIELPAADRVTDETDAVNRLFGRTTGG